MQNACLFHAFIITPLEEGTVSMSFVLHAEETQLGTVCRILGSRERNKESSGFSFVLAQCALGLMYTIPEESRGMPAEQSLCVLLLVSCDPRKEERENAEAFCGTLLDARLPLAKRASQQHNLRAVILRFPSPCMSHWTSHPCC